MSNESNFNPFGMINLLKQFKGRHKSWWFIAAEISNLCFSILLIVSVILGFRYWQIPELCFPAISGVFLILVNKFLEYRNPELESSERIALKTCLVAVWLAFIPSFSGGSDRSAPTAFVLLDMLSFSTSFSVLFLSGNESKFASFCRYCSVFSLLAAISVLVASFLLSSPDPGRVSALEQ